MALLDARGKLARKKNFSNKAHALDNESIAEPLVSRLVGKSGGIRSWWHMEGLPYKLANEQLGKLETSGHTSKCTCWNGNDGSSNIQCWDTFFASLCSSRASLAIAVWHVWCEMYGFKFFPLLENAMYVYLWIYTRTELENEHARKDPVTFKSTPSHWTWCVYDLCYQLEVI